MKGRDLNAAVRAWRSSLVICLLLPCLSSCGNAIWNRDYRLRFWEKNRLAAETAYLKRDFKSAREFGYAAVHEAEDLGSNDFRLGVSLAALGDACRRLGEHAEAEDYYDRATMVLKNAGKSATNDKVMSSLIRQDSARVQNSMGLMYASEKKFALAATHFEKSIKIYDELCRTINGLPEDYFLAQEEVRALASLAKTYSRAGKYTLAETTFRKALEQARASDYPELASREITTAYLDMLQSIGHSKSAVDILALLQWQDCMTEALQSCAAQRWAEAEQYLDKCLSATKQFPERTDCLTKTLAQLVSVYVRTGRLPLAEACCHQAIHIFATSSDDSGFELDTAMTVLGTYYTTTRERNKAIPLLMSQYKLRTRLFGAGSIQSADILAGLANAFQAAGDTAGASQAAERSRQIILLPAYVGSKRAIPAAFELGKVYQFMSNFVRSEEMYRFVVDATARRYQPCDEKIISARECLIQVCLQEKKYKDANEQLDLIGTAIKNGSSQEKVKTIPYLLLLCDTYSQLAMYREAQQDIAIAGLLINEPDVAPNLKAAVEARLKKGYEPATAKKAP